MKTINKIVGIVTSISLAGIMSCCSNDLTEKVYSSITQDSYEYTVKDFKSVVSSVYSPLRGVFSHTGFWTANEVTGDAIVSPPTATGWYDGGQYMHFHYHDWNSELANIKEFWDWMYRGALFANYSIELIESGKVPAPSLEAKEQGIMELRAARAFYYWLICDNFGDAPLVITTSDEMPEKSSMQHIYITDYQ